MWYLAYSAFGRVGGPAPVSQSAHSSPGGATASIFERRRLALVFIPDGLHIESAWGHRPLLMTDIEAIRIIRSHVEGLFPRECPNCHRHFATLREYILATQPIGTTISYDAEAEDWKPAEPVGTTAMANCVCGTTLTISSEGLSLLQMWRLLHWTRLETKRRGISYQKLLDEVREEIRRQVLAEPAPG